MHEGEEVGFFTLSPWKSAGRVGQDMIETSMLGSKLLKKPIAAWHGNF